MVEPDVAVDKRNPAEATRAEQLSQRRYVPRPAGAVIASGQRIVERGMKPHTCTCTKPVDVGLEPRQLTVDGVWRGQTGEYPPGRG